MRRGRLKTVTTGLVAVTAAAGIAACGSSGSGSGGSGSGGQAASSNPQTLLKQTFSSANAVKSGRLDFKIVITPTGSSLVTSPITLDLSGPFVQGGQGQAPQSDLTISFNGVGKHASFGVLTTNSAAYISLEGTSYKLPAAQFAQIKKSVATGKQQGTLPGLSALGIDPENWLENPKIVGTETIDGTPTEHLTATLDVPEVLGDFNQLVSKDASKLGVASGTDHLSAATIKRVTAAIKNPTIDLWTGKSDSILRQLQLAATVPVSGSTSTELGGMTSASFKVSIDSSDINQPQTITPPAHASSYAALQTKLDGIVQGLGLGGLGTGSTGTGATGSTGTTTTGSGSASSPSTAQFNKYSKCLDGAKGDVTKMQKCAALLNGGGQ